VVLLSGEAGIGKTRIVEEFGDMRSDALRFRWQCKPNHTNSPLHPFIQAFGRASGFEHADSPDVRIMKVRRRLHELDLASEEAVATFARILSLDVSPQRDSQSVDPEQRKSRTLGVLVDYLARLASRQPVLLQIEDVHWSDPTTLELSDRIRERAASLPLMMIVTARPEFQPSWPTAPHIVHQPIARLSRDDCAAMIRALAGDKPVARVVLDQILTKTDGVPLFIEELMKELLESGMLNRDDQGLTLKRPLSQLIPPTLQDSLSARLDRLGWVKVLAQTAAVIGRDFSPLLLEQVSNLAPAQLTEGLQRLCDAQVVTPHSQDRALTTYTFRHALIQDAAYAGLLLSERRVLHAAIAGKLTEHFPETAQSQPELVAHHHSEAHQPDQAVIWWRQAGRRSIQTGAYLEAIDQLNRCLSQLELLAQSEDRDRLEAELRLDLGVPLIGVGGYTSPAFRANVEREIVLHGRTKNVAFFPSLAGQISVAFSGSHMTRATELGERLLSTAEQSGVRAQRVIGHWLFGMSLFGAGRLVDGLDNLSRSLALNDPDMDAPLAAVYGVEPRVAALGYHALALQMLGCTDQATASDMESAARSVANEDVGTRLYALTLRVCLHILRRDYAALSQSASELEGLAQRQSSQPREAFSRVILNLLRAAEQPREDALARARQGLEEVRDLGWNTLVGWLSLLEAEICLKHDRVITARQTLDTLHDLIVPRGHHFFLPELIRLKAGVAEQEGMDSVVSEEHLSHAMEIARRQGARLAELRSATDLARLWQKADRADAALKLLDPVVDGFPQGVEPVDLQQARSLLLTLCHEQWRHS
jgi:hypothetical protein